MCRVERTKIEGGGVEMRGEREGGMIERKRGSVYERRAAERSPVASVSFLDEQILVEILHAHLGAARAL